MHKRLWAVLTLAATLISIGCAGNAPKAEGTEEQVSGGPQPVWTSNPSDWDTKGAKAFVGVSENVSTEVEARDGALENARKQIIDAMGVNGERKIFEVISSSGLASNIVDPAVVRDAATKLVSQSKVRTRAKEFHTERWKRYHDNRVAYYFKTYVLVQYENAEARTAVIEALQQNADSTHDEKSRALILQAQEKLQKEESSDGQR